MFLFSVVPFLSCRSKTRMLQMIDKLDLCRLSGGWASLESSKGLRCFAKGKEASISVSYDFIYSVTHVYVVYNVSLSHGYAQ